MKKVLLSLAAASLVFIGCTEDKKEEAETTKEESKETATEADKK